MGQRTEGELAHRTPDLSLHRSPGEDRNPKKLQLKLWLGKSACGSVSPIYHLLASKTARVVEWQTRTFEGRMPKGMRVQVPPRAPPCCLRGNPNSRVRYSMDEVIGRRTRDGKNERPFRINSFHPNDLVARSKRTEQCTATVPPPSILFSVSFYRI